MKNYMEKEILNVNVQNQNNTHNTVPSFIYGGYNSALTGKFIYGKDGIDLSCKEDNIHISYDEIKSIEFSVLFRRMTSRTLPENAVYIDMYIMLNNNESYELNSLDHYETKAFYEYLVERNICVEDKMKVFKLMDRFNEQDHGFYYFMRDHGKEFADKFDLEYPKMDTLRTQ